MIFNLFFSPTFFLFEAPGYYLWCLFSISFCIISLFLAVVKHFFILLL
nr:MAG TPA: hypothetical protein [Caudoviricetes sp.]